MLRGENNSNPNKRVLKNLTSMITAWRAKKVNREVIIMVDMNEFIWGRKYIYDLWQHNDLIDLVSLLDPDMDDDPTCLWGSKRIY